MSARDLIHRRYSCRTYEAADCGRAPYRPRGVHGAPGRAGRSARPCASASSPRRRTTGTPSGASAPTGSSRARPASSSAPCAGGRATSRTTDTCSSRSCCRPPGSVWGPAGSAGRSRAAASRPASAASAATRPSRPWSPPGTRRTTASSASASASRAPAVPARRALLRRRVGVPLGERGRLRRGPRGRPHGPLGDQQAALAHRPPRRDWHFYLARTKGYGKGSPLVQAAAHRRPAARGPGHRHVPLRARGAAERAGRRLERRGPGRDAAGPASSTRPPGASETALARKTPRG